MHHSIYIELTIVTVSFLVALAAVWRLHLGDRYIRRIEAENAALRRQLDACRGGCEAIGNGMGFCHGEPKRGGRWIAALALLKTVLRRRGFVLFPN
jgi:hypothetical protein